MTTSSHDSPHLDHRHRDTLRKLFEHPPSHNVEWREVVSLLKAVGTAEHRKDGKLKVTVGTNSRVLERPKGKDVDEQEIVDVRTLLREAGYGGE